MTVKIWRSTARCLNIGLLCILYVVMARASTVFNLSSGTAAYNITSDTNGGTDADYTGPAIVVTSLPTGSFAHIANGLSDGTDTGVWVGPNTAQASETSSVSGTTVYQVSFNLAAYNISTAILSMSLGADDYVSSILLNSTNIFTASGTEITNSMWATATSLPSVTSGFISGVNTLTFTVANSTGDGSSSCCGPTGLIVAADVFASAAVPEPGTLELSGLCLMGLVTLLCRRRAAALGR